MENVSPSASRVLRSPPRDDDIIDELDPTQVLASQVPLLIQVSFLVKMVLGSRPIPLVEMKICMSSYWI